LVSRVPKYLFIIVLLKIWKLSFIDREHNIVSTEIVDDVDVEYSKDKETGKCLIYYDL